MPTFFFNPTSSRRLVLWNTQTTPRQVGKTTPQIDMTQNHLIFRLQSRNFRECGLHLHCYYFQIYSDFSFKRFIRVLVVHPYGRTDAATTRKKSRFILSESSNFHMIDKLSITIHSFFMLIRASLSVDLL